MCVEEGEWAGAVEGFEPERDLGDLDGEVVEVDAVDAALDGVGGGGANGLGPGFGVASADGGEGGGDPACGGDDEVAAADRRIEHCDGQQGCLRLGCVEGVCDQW